MSQAGAELAAESGNALRSARAAALAPGPGAGARSGPTASPSTAASKGAVLALTLVMAADHASEGIRVNAVASGTADTPWVARSVAPWSGQA